MSQKICFYYQTTKDINPLLKLNLTTGYIYFASLHFGYQNNKPYLHLNDDTPDNQVDVINDMKICNMKGLKVMVMLGGAGGAYTNLFSNRKTFYQLLANFIQKYSFIKGIDLDIEELVNLSDVKWLINSLKLDFGDNFIITMAPIAQSLEIDISGLGGFIYKDLYQSDVGKLISWFNVQAYGDYSVETVTKIVQNGYPIHKIVLGILGDNYTDIPKKAIDTIIKKYHNINGWIIWEYGDSKLDPIKWAEYLKLKDK